MFRARRIKGFATWHYKMQRNGINRRRGIMLKTTWATSLILLLLAVSTASVSAQETTSYMISWESNPEPELGGYIIYRGTDADYTQSEIIDSVGASATSYVDAGLTKGEFYYYWLRAKSVEGNRSPFSNTVSGMTIPQGAAPTMKNLCRITDTNYDSGSGSCDVNWETYSPTTGFVQYDQDEALDSTTVWDENLGTTHLSSIFNLVSPSTYFMRAVSFDEQGNMIISAIDTMDITGENPTPIAAPTISIYPVPYN
jgi:hypothetical protein